MAHASHSTDLAGQQTNSEHAEAGAALRDLRLPLLEDCEGADLQARLRQGLQFRKSEKVKEPSFFVVLDDDMLSICCLFVSEGQQAAHPSELQRHHLRQPGQVAWLTSDLRNHIILMFWNRS